VDFGLFRLGEKFVCQESWLRPEKRKDARTGFAELFKHQIDDERVNNFLDSITARVPTEVMLFEVAKE
jgi:hypothetical protein